jgi:DNA excision repair protein ERCC-4
MQIPPGFTAIIDTREKLPYVLKIKDIEIPQRVGTLKTGDYSIEGFEDQVGIERKSVIDLLGCVGKHRARFEREITRLEGMKVKALVVEGSWRLIENGNLMTRVHPNAAVGSLLSWVSRGIPVLMLENRERASEYVSRLLIHAYKRLVPGTAEVIDVDEDSSTVISSVASDPWLV